MKNDADKVEVKNKVEWGVEWGYGWERDRDGVSVHEKKFYWSVRIEAKGRWMED